MFVKNIFNCFKLKIVLVVLIMRSEQNDSEIVLYFVNNHFSTCTFYFSLEIHKQLKVGYDDFFKPFQNIVMVHDIYESVELILYQNITLATAPETKQISRKLTAMFTKIFWTQMYTTVCNLQLVKGILREEDDTMFAFAIPPSIFPTEVKIIDVPKHGFL